MRIFGVCLLALLSLVLATAAGLYLYLSPDEPPPKIAAPSTVRTITTGEIIGFQGKNDAHTWWGLPYAQAPVGELRWRAPRPPVSWEGRREMLSYGEQCVQFPTVSGGEASLLGAEDCLFLNVWAPTIGPERIREGTDRLPVMFWIHGGGNSVRSGGTDANGIYDGSMLATDHNVIVVTLNYRMGPLGWFAHPALAATSSSPEDASGNFGTLDLIAALQWVQANAASFGGDPDNVTIFGESAGGTNVLSLMASPLAAGLFHKAIVQSGSFRPSPLSEAQDIGTTASGTARVSAREIGARLLVQSGQADNRTEAIAKQEEISSSVMSSWLRSVSVEELYSVVDGSFAGMITMPKVLADGYVIPVPADSGAFTDPASYNAVPLMIGSTRDEAKLFFAFDPRYVELTNGFPVGINDLEAYNRDTRYGSDVWRSLGVDSIAEQVSLSSPEGVYVYRFDADDWRDFGFIDLKELIGAGHALELPFVFGYFPKPSRVLFPDSTFEEVELLSNAIMSYWSNFAHTGKPGTGQHDEEPLWRPWRDDRGGGNLLLLDTEIDQGIRMERQLLEFNAIKEAWLTDDSFASLEDRCRSHAVVFFISGSSAAERQALGCQ